MSLPGRRSSFDAVSHYIGLEGTGPPPSGRTPPPRDPPDVGGIYGGWGFWLVLFAKIITRVPRSGPPAPPKRPRGPQKRAKVPPERPKTFQNCSWTVVFVVRCRRRRRLHCSRRRCRRCGRRRCRSSSSLSSVRTLLCVLSRRQLIVACVC